MLKYVSGYFFSPSSFPHCLFISLPSSFLHFLSFLFIQSVFLSFCSTLSFNYFAPLLSLLRTTSQSLSSGKQITLSDWPPVWLTLVFLHTRVTQLSALIQTPASLLSEEFVMWEKTRLKKTLFQFTLNSSHTWEDKGMFMDELQPENLAVVEQRP